MLGYHNPALIGLSNDPPPPAFTGAAIIRQLEKRVGALTAEEVNEIDLKVLETLRNAARKTRLAWFSDYRRALKKARKTGAPVEVPEL